MTSTLAEAVTAPAGFDALRVKTVVLDGDTDMVPVELTIPISGSITTL
jgi:hypothetical protein